jgi:hypothetical protein
VLPALLAFSTYAATAADGGRAAREVARSVIGLNAEASAISDQEVANTSGVRALARMGHG